MLTFTDASDTVGNGGSDLATQDVQVGRGGFVTLVDVRRPGTRVCRPAVSCAKKPPSWLPAPAAVTSTGEHKFTSRNYINMCLKTGLLTN